MILHCQAPGCMKEAVRGAKFSDPRRGDGEKLAYVLKHYCSDECQLAICDELERVAHYARLVH